jgi:hypothetical protein
LKRYRQFVVIPGSLVIAAMGIWWMIQRIWFKGNAEQLT